MLSTIKGNCSHLPSHTPSQTSPSRTHFLCASLPGQALLRRACEPLTSRRREPEHNGRFDPNCVFLIVPSSLFVHVRCRLFPPFTWARGNIHAFPFHLCVMPSPPHPRPRPLLQLSHLHPACKAPSHSLTKRHCCRCLTFVNKTHPHAHFLHLVAHSTLCSRTVTIIKPAKNCGLS